MGEVDHKLLGFLVCLVKSFKSSVITQAQLEAGLILKQSPLQRMHPNSLYFHPKDPCPLLMKQMKGKRRILLPVAAQQGPSPPPLPPPPPQHLLPLLPPQTYQKLLLMPLSPLPQHPGLCLLLLPALTLLLPRASLIRSLPSSPLSLPLNQLTEIATLSLVSKSLGCHCLGLGWV